MKLVSNTIVCLKEYTVCFHKKVNGIFVCLAVKLSLNAQFSFYFGQNLKPQNSSSWSVAFTSWGRFHIAKTPEFFFGWENTNRIILALINATFLATNIRQNVTKLRICVAHFCIPVALFGIFNAKFVFRLYVVKILALRPIWNLTLKMP